MASSAELLIAVAVLGAQAVAKAWFTSDQWCGVKIVRNLPWAACCALSGPWGPEMACRGRLHGIISVFATVLLDHVLYDADDLWDVTEPVSIRMMSLVDRVTWSHRVGAPGRNAVSPI